MRVERIWPRELEMPVDVWYKEGADEQIWFCLRFFRVVFGVPSVFSSVFLCFCLVL